MTIAAASSCLARLARALRRDRSGVALMEFAFTLPVVIGMGGWGVELSYLTVTHLRVFQAAVNLADAASRVGTLAGNVTQLREADINDVLQGIRLTNAGIQLTTYGRVTLSSLENVAQAQDNGTRVQRIHWRRCMGIMSGSGYDSTYDTTDPSDGTTVDTLASHPNEGVAKPNGMGDAGKEVKAPNDSGVMFVEVNYLYRPLFGSMFVNQQIIHYTQSFLVRDNRDFGHIWNPGNAAQATCDKHNA